MFHLHSKHKTKAFSLHAKWARKANHLFAKHVSPVLRQAAAYTRPLSKTVLNVGGALAEVGLVSGNPTLELVGGSLVAGGGAGLALSTGFNSLAKASTNADKGNLDKSKNHLQKASNSANEVYKFL